MSGSSLPDPACGRAGADAGGRTGASGSGDGVHSGESLVLEDAIKAFIRRRDDKPGDVFLGVVHRIDRPVSGAVLFAKTGKALVRLNEMMRSRGVDKTYWAITERLLPSEAGELHHHIVRDGRVNRSRAHTSPVKDSKEARLKYRMVAGSKNYYMYEVELLTGRHHQIRAQLSREGAPIRGDLKYGAARSNPDGGISLHSRSISLVHPVRREPMTVVAPVPQGDNLWAYFEQAAESVEN